MSDLFFLTVSLGIGITLGWGYLFALWKTLEQLSRSTQPALLMYGSLMFRLVMVLSVFFAMMRQGWTYLAVGLLGFLLMRSLLIRRWGWQPALSPQTRG